MDAQDFRSLQEAYLGVYIQEEVDLWVSELVEEGYDIDEYTDEELLKAFLDERKNEDPKGIAHKAGINKPDAWGPPTKFGQEATRNSLAAGIKGVRKLQRAGVRINRHHRNKFLAHQVHKGWSKAAENSPHQTPEQQERRKKLINKDLGSFRKNLSKTERDKDVPFVKKAERAANKQGEFAESYDLYDIILSHLLDEGYAETVESAQAIMVNMSEEWRDEIVEGRGVALGALGAITAMHALSGNPALKSKDAPTPKPEKPKSEVVQTVDNSPVKKNADAYFAARSRGMSRKDADVYANRTAPLVRSVF